MVHMGRPTARKTGHMKFIPTGIRPNEPIQCLLPITRRRLQNQPSVCQRRQIAIHRTETDRRRFCLIQQSLYVSGGKGSIRMGIEELKKTLTLRCHVHTDHLICPSSYSRGRKNANAGRKSSARAIFHKSLTCDMIKETLIKSLSDLALAFSCKARNNPARIASYLRRVMTKHCMKIHTKSDSAI